ncbi:MAG: CRISPR-associated endonuclease Cas2 [Patescibacteria group bacterium]|jgi:hypothetical protein
MKLSKNVKAILSTIGLGLALTVASTSPYFLVNLVKSKNKYEKYRYKKIIKKLFDDKIIYLSGEEIKLSENGLELLRLAQVEDITIAKGKGEWDGFWHLVCYDVPESYKQRRDCFRRKLIESGFYQVQYSLWVIPWPCKEEIAIIAQSLDIAPFVAYLNTDYLPQQQKLLNHFDLA